MSVCGRVAFCGSYGRDNGEAGTGGQPARGAFPKGFVSLLLGLRAPTKSVDESAFQQRFNALVEFLEARFADDHLTADEKGRGPLDLQHVLGKLLAGTDLVLHRLALQAILDRLRAQPGLASDRL